MSTATSATLGEIIDSIRSHHKTVRVRNFTGDPESLAAIRSHFEPHDVDVETVTERGGPTDVVELESNGTVDARSDVETVLAYVRAWEDAPSSGLSREPPDVVARLDDTYFESYDKKRMVMASRIVEFRGINVGDGTLHAGFQDLEKIDYQRSTYRHLTERGLEVHVYGAPAPETTTGLDVHAHESTGEEVARHWWVAFDGAGEDDKKAVLLAAEREPDEFYGFWTYEPGVVDDVLARMRALD